LQQIIRRIGRMHRRILGKRRRVKLSLINRDCFPTRNVARGTRSFTGLA
jgi:hypothetical protein